MKTTTRLFSAVLVLVLCITTIAGCAKTESPIPTVETAREQGTIEQPKAEEPSQTIELPGYSVSDVIKRSEPEETKTPVSEQTEKSISKSGVQTLKMPGKGTYAEGVILVKYEGEAELTAADFGEIAITSFEPLYRGSLWYRVVLNGAVDTVEAAEKLSSLETFSSVDYDYIMNGDAEVESIDISGNDYEPNPGYFKPMEVQEGWKSLIKDGKEAGGSPDVIVAVIDTGVDYNHVDLRNNIWRNPGEIPNNGIDDDGNGYVDDIYGWNCVGDNNNPMDDNGHGTHVAGIIAAENNKIGTVGIAYNCKVMCLKAGTSSGTFNNSDIAEAIRYAYMNGASVINMSFGGTSISLAVEEALEDAYNQCVLVASAGNDGMCNQPGCSAHYPLCMPVYPASLTYVIGVMSCDADGTAISPFSNFDHYLYNTYEYDVYAPGEEISSTFPNNKYAKLSGTSMAAPAVAGIAALVRSYFTDREQYSTKFITAQIVRGGGNYICASVYDALNVLPTPSIYGIHDYYIFDNVEFDPEHNNGNGIIEAGETIHLGFELMNRGGKASDVTISVNTKRLAEDITDPYIHILSNDITYSEIGTYSIRDGGKIYDDNGKVIDVEHPIIIKIDEETPNDYLSVINFNITYNNGLDEKDTKDYSRSGSVTLTVSNGYILPEVIDEDTVYEANRKYLVVHDVHILDGVTVTFEEGCEIIFYAENASYYDDIMLSPSIIVKGNLLFKGTEQNNITIHPSENFPDYMCSITKADFYYTNATNICYYINNPYLSMDMSINNVYNAYHSVFQYSSNAPKKIICYGRSELIHAQDMRFDDFIDSKYMFCPYCPEIYSSNYTFRNSRNSVFDYKFGMSQKVPFLGIDGDNNCVISTCIRPNSASENPSFSISGNNNVILNSIDDVSISECPTLYIYGDNNALSEGFIPFASKIIKNYYDDDYQKQVVIKRINEIDDSVIWPYIKNIELFDKNGEKIRIVGGEKVTAKVTFNRPMDKSIDFKLYYGSVAPYRDYVINGSFAEDGMSWTGEFQVKATIEGGRNFFSAGDACAADDSFKALVNNAPAFAFDIDMTQAMSMNLQGVGTEDGIELTWVQDDYDTLMGYNVYRSDSKDGNFVRINPSVIPAGENTYLDIDAEPGKLYWYTFTVVLSDFTESKPAGKVSCRSADTINPTVYHTPVNQGYANNNLVISCTASDNIAIDNVKLYYRTIGAAEWKVITMAKQNDRYSATIFGSEVTLAGLEYYIVASDGRNEVRKGSAEAPYTVLVKDASALSTYGDVDGDGVVTTKDALMLIQAINGDLLLTDDQFKRADLNKDGELSSMEALRILQYINGKITTLEM